MSSNRPLFIGYWAQDALSADIGDADVYVPTNPVYPEQVDQQYETGWFVSPDEDVKQPHQWMNQWLQNTDYILHSWHISMSTWLPEMEYLAGAVVHLEGKRFIAQRANAGENPLLYPDTWEEAAFYTKKQAEDDLAAHTKDFEDHRDDQSNPHNVHIHQLNGYTKEEIDALEAAQAGDLRSHIDRRDNPHNVTYQQLGILPVSGGNHTGLTGVGRMDFRAGQSVRKTGDSLHLRQGEHKLEVKDDGRCTLDNSVLVDESNHRSIRHNTSSLFRAPTPDWHLALVSDINSYPSTFGGVEYKSSNEFMYHDKAGVLQVAEVDTPAFTTGGLVLSPESVQSLTVTFVESGGTILAEVDGVVRGYAGHMSSQNLLDYFVEFSPKTITNVKVWYGFLSKYQLSSQGLKL